MPIQTVAVLGAGVMGSQIAAHLVNIGLDVDLLDLASTQGNKNQVVEGAFQKACQLKPPIFFTDGLAQKVRLGNYDEHFHWLQDADWIIEAVVEKLAVKQDLMQRIEAIAKPTAIISSNTSGLPIGAIAKPCSVEFRRRFLGTHFFNPPRYLKLLELIPSQETDPQILAEMKTFAERQMGKGVVIAKDTPNFIANRIGMYVILQGIQALAQGKYSLSDIDALTGSLMGRPKSATFRTADLVGLDTISYVAHNLYEAIPDDEQREVFVLPKLMQKLVTTGSFGAKSGQGFYKKVKGEILQLNPQDFSYQPLTPVTLPDYEKLQQMTPLADRLRALYSHPGLIGEFFREMLLSLFAYCAHRIPEICDTPQAIDQAMKWGFGWEMGPFEIWETLGTQTVLKDLQARQINIPQWIEAQGQTFQAVHSRANPEAIASSSSFIQLDQIRNDPDKVIWHNRESALLDLGDEVVLFEFRSKGNTLSLKVIEGLETALGLLSDHPYRGMVIGNGDAHFSGGANLVEMGGMAMSGSLEGIQNLIVSFQTLLERIHTFPKPIVAAVQGRALGGGCELVMATPHVVASVESYIGLVELSVGLIPGAGGITRLVLQVTQRAASDSPVHIQPFLMQAFETIAMAKVSKSAQEAREFGYLRPCDRILVDGDRRLTEAKSWVIQLADSGYIAPSQRRRVQVLGQPARAMMDMIANQMLDGHYISEYDRFLAGELAYVMTGGDLTEPSLVPESYLLQLERERFVPLLSQPKTQARIAHLLKTKKPLRN